MSALRLLHAADLHLDSPFEGLSGEKAAVRRKEQRELLAALANLAQSEQVDLVLLAGDLLDSQVSFAETGEGLVRALRAISVPVIIAPGNHDFYNRTSPYARLRLPGNVCVFSSHSMQKLELPELGARVYGAAFTEKHSGPLLRGFRAERTEGIYNLMVLHGELAPRSVYNPISREEIAQSGLDYLALGHIHKASGLLREGWTWYSWPGCPEGRGFDEGGEKAVSIVELEGEQCRLRPARIATRRYETLRVDVTGTDPLLAVHTQLPDDTVRDVYRIILTGEAETPPDLKRLRSNLEELFFSLQLKDETRLRRDLWENIGENSLRGLFLKGLRQRYEAAQSEDQRRLIQQAARWGLAALENGEEVAVHEDP